MKAHSTNTNTNTDTVAETIIATLLRIGETVALRGAWDPDVGQWNGSWLEMIRRTRLNYI